MTRRDVVWRAFGASLSIGGCVAASMLDRPPLTVGLFLVVLAGLTMMINGKRVGIMLQAERRGHCHTVTAIHAERIRRRRNRAD